MGNSLPSGKSATVAQKKRTEGNEFFKKKDYPSAVRLYSDSVCKAPTDITNGRKPINISV
jgi:hypothetical protein